MDVPIRWASATGTTESAGWAASQGCAASSEAKKWTWLQNADRNELISSGLIKETTAVAGSTPDAPTLSRIGTPVAWLADSIRAVVPSRAGKIRVSRAHQV